MSRRTESLPSRCWAAEIGDRWLSMVETPVLPFPLNKTSSKGIVDVWMVAEGMMILLLLCFDGRTEGPF